MESPKLCDRVRVRGEQNRRTYIVISIDEESATVDLVAAAGSTHLLNGVPFSKLIRPGERSGS
ncbi:hypothetical protein [Occallatibacter riparius]|uniref:Uncharacterized protein n=1 Tax=Occallatibacter riparius TaxID=1002689 RepID=A0A9J7BHU4_9BACT|nr:hypothetical protein [Occallatibacter riparius]UWZ82368.1 hypothetical protein MOP44_17535 [Occallatibacter riparius]